MAEITDKEGPSSIVELKQWLGPDIADLLTFEEESDLILAKPKKYIADKGLWDELDQAVKRVGGLYLYGYASFEIPKAQISLATTVKSEKKTAQPKQASKTPEDPRAAKTPHRPGEAKAGALGVEKSLRRFEMIPVKAVLSMPFQSRLEAPSEEELNELIESFHSHGILMPIFVRPRSDGLYELVAGRRRHDAAKKAGFEVVPAIVREMTDQEAYEAHLIENLQRKDLTDYEKARMLDYLLKNFPEAYPTQEALGEKLGKTQAWVSYHLRMLELAKDENITRVIKPEELTEGQAREILAAPPEKRGEVAEQIAEYTETEGKPPSMQAIRKIVKPLEEPKKFVISGEAQFITCTNCGVATSEPLEWRGKPVCSVCYEKLLTPKPRVPVGAGFESAEPKPKPQPIDTGILFECPECHEKLLIVHVAPGKHKFEKPKAVD